MTSTDSIRRRWQWLLAALLLLVGLTLAPRRATGAPQGQGKQARELFFKGTRAFAAKKYPQALRHFRASYALRPKAVVLFNIAMCQRALGHYRESISAFERYLKQAGRWIKPRRRKRVRVLIAQMRAQLGQLVLRASPAGVQVRIDGVLRGTTPLKRPIFLNPGAHQLTVLRDGYKPHTRTIHVARGQQLTLPITLEELVRPTLLTISASVRGALVRVDSGALRHLPVTLRLRGGDHRLHVTAPGHRPRTVVVRLQSGEHAHERVTLEPMVRRRRSLAAVRRPGLPTETSGTDHPHRPPPFYRRAWFWSVVTAVVLSAGAASGYLLWKTTHPGDSFDRTYRLQ